jgi:hypothetical protein
LLLESEAHLLRDEDEKALEKAQLAIERMPASEALLRARGAAIAGQAARSLGKLDEALAYLQLVLAIDPGIIRRLGMTLPVELVPEGGSPAVAEAIDTLESSPLFDAGDWGFQLVVGESEVALVLPDGTDLSRARVRKGKDDELALSRRIARAAHEELLVPNVDLTQSDIHSLDGGLGGGGRASERTRSVLQDMLSE